MPLSSSLFACHCVARSFAATATAAVLRKPVLEVWECLLPFHHTQGSLYVMEACAAEAAVVVVLLLCQTIERTGIFETAIFSFCCFPLLS